MKIKHAHQISFFFLLIQLVFIAASCATPSYSNHVNYTALGAVDCKGKAHNIFLFFEGETTDFDYRKVGLVQVSYALDEEMVYQLMKQEAWEQCGNVLLQVKKVSQPEVYTDSNGDVSTRNHTYYTGIVAQIDESSAFWQKHRNEVDTSFLAYNRKSDEQLEEGRGGGVFIATSLAILGLIGILTLSAGTHP